MEQRTTMRDRDRHEQRYEERRVGSRGASSVEYALLIGLIAAVIVFAVSALGQDVLALFDIEIPGMGD
jgi:cell division protein FtsL